MWFKLELEALDRTRPTADNWRGLQTFDGSQNVRV